MQKLTRLAREVRQLCMQALLPLKNFKAEDSIIIFSESRSGSTWLMEILNNIPNACVNWEPLHDFKGVVPDDYNWGWRPFISPDEENEAYLNLIHEILSFSTYTKWTTRYLTFKDLLSSEYVITKFVRANLLIPYILENLELKRKPILLLRHPIDVCLSQINAFESSDSEATTFEIPDTLNNDRFIEHQAFLQKLETKLEQKIANWCLNNVLVLNNPKILEQVLIVFYNELLAEPKGETQRILRALDLPKEVQTIVRFIDFRKASSTDFSGQLAAAPEKQLFKNFNRLSTETKEQLQKIFDYFDFKLYTAFSPYPNKQYLHLH